MFSNFDRLLLCFFLSLRMQVFTQEIVPFESTNKNEKVSLELKFGYLVANALGDNFLAKAYDINNGVVLDARFNVNENWYFGAQMTRVDSKIIDIVRVGNFDSAVRTHLSLVGGYSIVSNENFDLKTGVGFGPVWFRNTAEEIKFNDSGITILGNAALTYRISSFFGIYINLQHNWDFLVIQTAPELKKFFNRTSLFNPSVGIQFYF